MSDGFIRWFQPAWPAGQALALVTSLEEMGWSLTNSVTGTISISGDDGRMPIERESLLAELALSDSDKIMFQWWLGETGADVFYDIARRSDGSVVHEFDLDGVGANLNRIEQDILSLIRAQASATTGAVFDRAGATQDLDWDAIMAGEAVEIGVVPDLLGLTRELDKLHLNLPSDHRTYAVDDLVIHDWEGIVSAE